ncbi:galactokinase-like [Stegodyphus dumicola]|uniref:galactokinase-like n=1 Tax=Stegodyphus dumicola TaxID=202533 RepID=UPI0015B21D69|nr:galactokinase-like [Stegodyphus dumicola]
MSNLGILDVEDVVNFAVDKYNERFNSFPTVCGCGPGRVNLIGEHTDYNDGFVLPMALPMATVVVGRQSSSRMCRIITTCPYVDDPIEVEFEIPDDESGKLLTPGKPMWTNYVKGVVANFKGKIVGFNAVISTNVPVGGGLSSSAALEVATYTFLEALNNEPSSVGLVEKALACQKAEHEYSGTPCGIMDQFISFMGKKDHALLLDCRSLEYELLSLNNPAVAVLITNTNVKHKLTESQYSKRKAQCETAAQLLGKSSLRDVTLIELQKHKEVLGNELYCRALHVVTEIQRTVEAAESLRKENYHHFGYLMKLSHESLRDNYEVSCPELDKVMEAALEIDGVFGSRMTGGGFGGCTVTLLTTDAIDKTMQNIKEKYEKTPTFYVCRPGDGARTIKLP